jgi:hypothetical protein
MISGQQGMDVPHLVSLLLARGERVVAFEHEADWIDVNDAAAVCRAERMVRGHFEAFEHWNQPPDCEVADLAISSAAGILIEQPMQTSLRSPRSWTIPGKEFSPQDGESAGEVAQRFWQAQGGPHLTLKFLISFDDLDPGTHQLIRHHVYFSQTEEARRPLELRPQWRWAPLDEIGSLSPLSSVLVRCASYLREPV